MATSNGRTVHVTHSLKSGYGVNNGQCTVSQFIRAGQAERPAPDHSVYQRMQHLPQFKVSTQRHAHSAGRAHLTSRTTGRVPVPGPQPPASVTLSNPSHRTTVSELYSALKSTVASTTAAQRSRTPVHLRSNGRTARA
eukprot:TRINITY_DN8075_c0_g1_i7.p1 TRINITY_DN8075_c0_g1~~TRINITY_DN8075_c0_g1_i7.p1  ORF type:complete len:138 (+),score=8.76 TRINITY_DN8075_c0_g1_i7:143-556(+)